MRVVPTSVPSGVLAGAVEAAGDAGAGLPPQAESPAARARARSRTIPGFLIYWVLTIF
jgi:hypothetical protein